MNTKKESSGKYDNVALTTLQTLINACGVEPEDEELAIKIISGTIENEVEASQTVFNKENIIAAIKEIRIEEDNQNDIVRFCNEHNFKLEEMLHRQIEDKLRRICHNMQNRFDLGYIKGKY